MPKTFTLFIPKQTAWPIGTALVLYRPEIFRISSGGKKAEKDSPSGAAFGGCPNPRGMPNCVYQPVLLCCDEAFRIPHFRKVFSGDSRKSGCRCISVRWAQNRLGCLLYTSSVLITVRSHPFPFRTRSLSSLVPKILGWRRPGKICLLYTSPLSYRRVCSMFTAPK